jgi:hypothetical protein
MGILSVQVNSFATGHILALLPPLLIHRASGVARARKWNIPERQAAGSGMRHNVQESLDGFEQFHRRFTEILGVTVHMPVFAVVQLHRLALLEINRFQLLIAQCAALHFASPSFLGHIVVQPSCAKAAGL